MLTIVILNIILVGLIFAPLGCMVLWKKFVYISDSLAHATVLTSVISTIIGIPILYAGILNTIIFTCLIFKLSNKNTYRTATIGLVANFMISCAFILSHIFTNKFEITNLLFGDPLSSSINDIYILSVIFLIVLGFILIHYRNLILIVISKDIARSNGVKVKLLEIAFLSILSFSVLVTIKIIGALLTTTMLLVPGMIANLFSRSPIGMIFFAMLASQIIILIGIAISFSADLPIAPAITITGSILYMILSFLSIKRR